MCKKASRKAFSANLERSIKLNASLNKLNTINKLNLTHYRHIHKILDMTLKWSNIHWNNSTATADELLELMSIFRGWYLKVLSATCFLVCPFSLKGALVKLRRMFFISLQKLFLFSRKSNFRILDIQIPWRYQMSKHKTRNIFYWITWEVNTVC